MSDVLTISGSPSPDSRSNAVLVHTRWFLESRNFETAAISVRDLDADELVQARFNGDTIKEAVAKVEAARAIIIGTPIYKAAYTGVLKAFLDLLPPDALANKIVFPIATGGSPAHLLAIDYALKPVLGVLGARHILGGLYIQDSQIQYNHGQLNWLDADVEKRLYTTLHKLIQHLTVVEAAPLEWELAKILGAERAA